MKKISTFLIVTIFLLLQFSCKNYDSTIKRVDIEQMKRVTRTLSSDRFMGRMPFTKGEELSIEFLANELKAIGFEPAFDSSYFQSVPMVMITSRVDGEAHFDYQGDRLSLRSPDFIAVNSPQPTNRVSVKDSKMVFAGFGIDSHEWDWNDFEGLDLKGKTLVVLINDPGLYTGDTSLFKGREMTYYGRWTYKYEEAARRGADAVLIVHEAQGAGYEYNVPRNSSITPRFFIDDNGLAQRCKVTGWLNSQSASTLFEGLGYNIDSLRVLAACRGFKPIELNATFSIDILNTIERNVSTNVAGILRGKSNPNEATIITAHWDHFGVGEPQNGDSIYNGAVDNGTTMAWALEIGRLFAERGERPDRSVVILFPTAEEQGLIGSEYYVQHPAIAIDRTIACFNNDMMVPRGTMRDVTLIGYGYSTLDSLYGVYAQRQKRYVSPDPVPHTGLFFRSDHFPFHKAGVPSIWAFGCYDSRKYGKEWAQEQWDDFILNVYHRPADNYNPDWDWSGIAQDVALTYNIIEELLRSDSPRPRQR